MKKLMIFIFLILFQISFAEIVGKVKEVKKDRGNLRIKVIFYDTTAPETTIAEESYYIADNEGAENTLKNYIKNKIDKLSKKEVKVEKPKAKESIKANIKSGLIIRKVYNFTGGNK